MKVPRSVLQSLNLLIHLKITTEIYQVPGIAMDSGNSMIR